MQWKSYSFYYLREGTSDDLDKIHEDLAFTNSPPRVHWDKIPFNNNYPVLYTNKVPEFIF